jgi:multidrug efflux pump subunit AcrB
MSSSDPRDSDHPEVESGPIAWMVHNPIAANLIMIILLVGGIGMAYTIQKEVFPEAQLDVVEVDVTYPGASPSEVETGVLLPIEEALRGISGIREMTSTAREASASVSLELIAGANRMKIYQEIDQEVSRIQTFPDDIEEPEVRLQSRQREVMEVGLYGDVDQWTLRKLAERLRNRFLENQSITQVELENDLDYVMHVSVPRHRLRELDMTLTEISQEIESSGRDVPAGDLQTSKGKILLRMKERKQWDQEFRKIPILATETGTTLKLGEMARVRDGFEETAYFSQFNGQPSTELAIYRVGSQSPLEISDAVKSTLAEFESELPPGVQARIDSNTADDYDERLSLLVENGILAVFIVLFILGLFLEYRLAFWVMMGMAISFVGAFLFLPWIGVTLNMVSMFAFLVVLGIVVDDAIVVGENVYEYREQGMDFVSAAIEGARDISVPVIFSILTNIVAFVPLLFIPGTMGNFWRPIPAVVIVVLTLSLFEALFILPAHLAHSSENSATALGRFVHRWQQYFADRFNAFVETYYRPFLDFCLKFRYVTLCLAITALVVVSGYAVSDHMGMIMMPEVAADEIGASVNMPSDTTEDQARVVAEQVTEATQRVYEEHDLHTAVEGITTNLYGTLVDVELVMYPANQRDLRADEIIELWRSEIGDIEGVDQITFQAERGPGGWRDDITVDISHDNISVLEDASQRLRQEMEQFENTVGVNDNYEVASAQLDFKIRPEGRQLGLTPSYVGQQLRSSFFGDLALRQLRGINEVEIRVKLPESQRRSLSDLEELTIRTPDGIQVPLMDVVRVEEGTAYNSINRRGGRRVISVGTDVQPKNEVGQVRASLDNEVLPELRAEFPGLSWTFEGSQAEMRESTQTLWAGFMLAMFVIYSLLAIAFGSYVQPLIVMFSIPFGIVGAVVGHILLGYSLSLISLMGIIALSGVVVNDSLIMIDYANRKREDESAFEAIHEAGIRRFRPILLTTLTTFGGLTPIILETSRQATYLIPMAISLGFGILFATSIILVIVPCLYMAFEDVNSSFK